MSKPNAKRNNANKPRVRSRPRVGPATHPVPRNRVRHATRLPKGTTTVGVPKGARYVGFGDYTEEKGRALYNKRKAKKKGGGKKESSWWDTISDVGSKALPILGKMAMTALTGFGDYEVNTNSVAADATNGKIGGQIPLMENTKCANIMHHREYLGPVNGTTDPFAIVQSFPLNPGMVEPFPWLSPIAACYTRYRMRGAVVCYEPLASDYTTAGSLGFVALASQYNPLDAPFTSKREMLNHEYSGECKPSKSMVHPIECAPNQLSIDEYYIRDGPPPENADLRFYDLCTVTVATGGNPVNTQVGELWITYEVEFYQPKISPTPGANNVASYCVTGTSATSVAPFANDIAPVVNTLACTVSDTTITFPYNQHGGTYLFEYYITGGTSVVLGVVTPTYTFCDFATRFQTTGTSTQYLVTGTITLTNSNATVTFSMGLIPLTGSWRLYITKYIAPTYATSYKAPLRKPLLLEEEERSLKYMKTRSEHKSAQIELESKETETILPRPISELIKHPAFKTLNTVEKEYALQNGVIPHVDIFWTTGQGLHSDSEEEDTMDGIAENVVEMLVSKGLIPTQEAQAKRDQELISNLLVSITSMMDSKLNAALNPPSGTRFNGISSSVDSFNMNAKTFVNSNGTVTSTPYL